MSLEPFLHTYIVDEESYPDGTVILQEGTLGRWAYVVLEGQVKVTKQTKGGSMMIETIGKGGVFGEFALLETDRDRARRTASVVASSAVRIGVLDREMILHEYDQLSPRLKRLIYTLLMRLKETTDRVANTTPPNP